MRGSPFVTAANMARERGIDPKRFRAALRAEHLSWHHHGAGWTVERGSSEHADLERILTGMATVGSASRTGVPAVSSRAGRSGSDEAWVIDLCDEVLGRKALRQHRFPFLVGDPGPSGRRTCLPVDAFYPDLKVVIEYHERQHRERVAFFDRRMTVSGMPRGEQRRRYDDLRRALLPENGYHLEILEWSEFEHDRAGRLLRGSRDASVVRQCLASYLLPQSMKPKAGGYA